MRLPACQILWMQAILACAVLSVITVSVVAKILNKSVWHAAGSASLGVFGISACLFWTRVAVYSGQPAPGDTAIGFPIVYAYGQSDAGLGPFYVERLLLDLIVGLVIGGLLIAIVTRLRQRKAQPTGRTYGSPEAGSPSSQP